jgi:type III restriction enzyme
MKITLKEFQDEAVIKLVRYLRGAAKDSKSGDRQSVCLSSPTGSGKTVMLTSAIELMLRGDEEHAPVADASFLWISTLSTLCHFHFCIHKSNPCSPPRSLMNL